MRKNIPLGGLTKKGLYLFKDEWKSRERGFKVQNRNEQAYPVYINMDFLCRG